MTSQSGRGDQGKRDGYETRNGIRFNRNGKVNFRWIFETKCAFYGLDPALYEAEVYADPESGVVFVDIFKVVPGEDGRREFNIVSMGTALQNPVDRWDRDKGRRLALDRAFKRLLSSIGVDRMRRLVGASEVGA